MYENTTSESNVEIQNDNNKSDEYTKITAAIGNNDDVSENAGMKLYINDIEIPVSWEDNDTTKELVEQVESGDIIVSMSMYSNNEQVGSLERSYTGMISKLQHIMAILFCIMEIILLYSMVQIQVIQDWGKWTYQSMRYRIAE